MACFVSLFRSCFPRPRKIDEKPTTIESLAVELLTEVFSRLDLSSLMACRHVCSSWKGVVDGSEAAFFLRFSEELNYFCRKGGKAFFSLAPKNLFIAHYRAAKPLPCEGKESPYQALQRYQSNPEALRTLYNHSVPSLDAFTEDREEKLKNFPYPERRELLAACLLAGAMRFEPLEENRLFSLAAFFGDISFIDQILKESNLTGISLNATLNITLFLAIEGNQPALITYLKREWKLSTRQAVFMNFSITDFVQQGRYAHLAPVIEAEAQA